MSRMRREKLFVLQDGICAYCYKIMTLALDEHRQPFHNTITIDHIKPKSRKGKFNVKNMIGACLSCNHKKANKKVKYNKKELMNRISQYVYIQEAKQ